MRLFAYLTAWLAAARDDRGDVPGWVMVTVMTAILVVAILGHLRAAGEERDLRGHRLGERQEVGRGAAASALR